MRTNKEQKIIKLCMIVLSLAIVMVYILLFQVKGKTLLGNEQPINTGEDISISVMSGEEQQTLTPAFQEIQEMTGIVDEEMTSIINTGTTFTANTGSQGGITILSGTNVFYGSIEIIEKLGIKYQYALVDSTGTYFIALGNPTYDFASIARTLKGNLYELKTEQEIAQNQLWGEKITFINLPEYKDKKVVMLVYSEDGVRLIRMDYNKYHKAKKYLKSLFIQ